MIDGTISDPRHVELKESVTEIRGPVRVILLPLARNAGRRGLLDVLAMLGPGTRDKGELDQWLADERAAWGEG